MLLFAFLIKWYHIHAAPTEHVAQAGLTTIPINAPLRVDGKASYKRALLKYSARTSLAQARLPEAKKWLNAAVITGDLDYLSPVQFQSQGQTPFHLSFDSASAETWVVSSQTPKHARGKKKAYISAKAQHLAGYRWNVPKHEDDFANGIVFRDTLKLGSLLVLEQAVGAAEYVSHELAATKIDGTLGLALPPLNRITPSRQLTPNANLLSSGTTRGVFAIDLHHGTRQVPGSCGQYEFGGHFNKYGFFSFAKINMSSGYWLFETPTFKIGGGKPMRRFSGLPIGLSINDITATYIALSSTNSTFNLSTSHQAIIDTATPLILLDDITLFAIYAIIVGAAYHHEEQAFVLPCARDGNSPPSVEFQVGEEYFSVPYRFGGLVYAELTPELCYGAIQSRGTMEFDVFGSAFLISNYVVFDEAEGRIGVARKNS